VRACAALRAGASGAVSNAGAEPLEGGSAAQVPHIRIVVFSEG